MTTLRLRHRGQGKALELVIAKCILYAVETYSLLLDNHFGARRMRLIEQALLVLQEQIYKAWRLRKVLSLISFDVKGVYNGVYKERLLQRLQARGILPILVQQIKDFCLNEQRRCELIDIHPYRKGYCKQGSYKVYYYYQFSFYSLMPTLYNRRLIAKAGLSRLQTTTQRRQQDYQQMPIIRASKG